MNFFDANISPMDTEELPRLVVLTGLNGSGKTKGLKALLNAAPDRAQYIDYQNFSANWSVSPYMDQNKNLALLLERINEWKATSLDALSQTTIPLPPAPMAHGHSRTLDLYDEVHRVNWLEQNQGKCKIGCIGWKFFEIFPEARVNFTDLPMYKKFLEEDTNRSNVYWASITNAPFNDDYIAIAFRDASKKMKLPVHCLQGEDVADCLYAIDQLKNPHYCDLGGILDAWDIKREEFIYNGLLAGKTAESADKEFREEKKWPIDYLNEILKDLADNENGVFQFQVQSDSSRPIPTYEQLKNHNSNRYGYYLKHTTLDDIRDLSMVSSGERTLLALATLVYTQKVFGSMRNIYLDEIDASLHPSMIKAMLKVLLKQSDTARIFLATHSPSTIALAPEDSLFLVEEGKAKKTNKTEALESLTQGYFTTEGIAAVFRSMSDGVGKIVVLSEGKNYKYLKAIFVALEIDRKIHLHLWPKGKAGGKGVSDLLPLARLFIQILTDSGSTQQVVFLFDCDAEGKVSRFPETNRVKRIAMKKLSTRVDRGIENLIPDKVLDSFSEEIIELTKKNNSNTQNQTRVKQLHKSSVEQKFIQELEANRIPLGPLREALNELIELTNQL